MVSKLSLKRLPFFGNLFIVFVVISFFQIGCESSIKVNTTKLIHYKDVSFYSGFQSFSFSKRKIELDGETYYCAADFMTHKKIILQGLESDKTFEVKLNQVIERGEKIGSYDIVSLDTIYVITSYTNHLYCINSSGEIWKTVDLNPSLKGFYDKDYKLEISSNKSPFSFKDTSLIFLLSHNLLNGDYDNLVDVWHKKNLDSLPQLIKIDNIYADTLVTTFSGYKFYSNFIEPKYCQSEMLKLSFENKQLVLKSGYTDTLYFFSPDSLILVNKLKINSEYSKVFVKPITLEENSEYKDLHNVNYNTQGQIYNFKYDEFNDKYFCSVVHDPIIEGDYMRPMSIIIFDGDLKKIEEIQLDTSKYYSKLLFINEGNLYISNAKKCKDDEDYFRKNTFSIFRYE